MKRKPSVLSTPTLQRLLVYQLGSYLELPLITLMDEWVLSHITHPLSTLAVINQSISIKERQLLKPFRWKKPNKKWEEHVEVKLEKQLSWKEKSSWRVTHEMSQGILLTLNQKEKKVYNSDQEKKEASNYNMCVRTTGAPNLSSSAKRGDVFFSCTI